MNIDELQALANGLDTECPTKKSKGRLQKQWQSHIKGSVKHTSMKTVAPHRDPPYRSSNPQKMNSQCLTLNKTWLTPGREDFKVADSLLPGDAKGLTKKQLRDLRQGRWSPLHLAGKERAPTTMKEKAL